MMNEIKEISIGDLLQKTIHNWKIFLVVFVFLFVCMAGSNYYLFNKADSNSFFTKEIDINLASAKDKDLSGTTKEVILSNAFTENTRNDLGITIDRAILDNIVYSQSYLDNENDQVYKIRLLVSSSKEKDIVDFSYALENTGKDLLQKRFDTDLSFEEGETSRIVAGRNANFNLASPYELYRQAHSLSVQNIIVWLLISLIAGIAVDVVWVLFCDAKLRKKTDKYEESV